MRILAGAVETMEQFYIQKVGGIIGRRLALEQFKICVPSLVADLGIVIERTDLIIPAIIEYVWSLSSTGKAKKPCSKKSIGSDIEIFPCIKLESCILDELFTYRERLAYRYSESVSLQGSILTESCRFAGNGKIGA